MSRVIVTGGAGFVGSQLVDALLERGDEVVALDNLATGRRENLSGALERGAHLIEADVADRAAVERAFEKHPPELVCHLAAQVDVRKSVADPRLDLDINAGGTINLLEASRRAGVGRFVFASTGGAIYGEGEGRELPLGESAEQRPDAPYGQSKLAAEGYVAVYERLHRLSGICLRLGNVYGPRQDPHGEAGVVAIFCGALLDRRRPRVFGDGLQTRDYIYVADVVDAFLTASASDATGPLNIGTGIETNVIELGRMLAGALGYEFDPEMAPHRPGEVQRIAIDSSLAERELGWRARVPIADGLRRTAEWFAEHR